MGDCVESLAEVKVDNIHGSPFVYPASHVMSTVGGRNEVVRAAEQQRTRLARVQNPGTDSGGNQ